MSSEHAAAAAAYRSPTGPLQAASVDTVRHVAALGYPLTSVYISIGDRLRCTAVGAYGQIFDGIPPGVGVIGRCFAEQREIRVADAAPGGAETPYRAAALHVRDELALPLLDGTRCIGVLNVESPAPIGPADVPRLRTAADGLAVELRRLGGPPAESLAQRLVRHATTLGDAQSLPQMAQDLLDAAQDLSGRGSGSLILNGRPAAAAGPACAALLALDASTARSVLSWVEDGGSSRSSGDTEAVPSPLQTRLADVGLRGFAVVPLHVRHELLGALLVGDDNPRDDDPATVESLELLAALAAASLWTMRASAVLRSEARTDHLTGLPHRRAFEEALGLALATCPPSNSVAVLLADLDGFKQINDANGHPAGDAVLKHAAAALSGALRGGDALYRVGGDEFAVIMLVPDDREAAAVADRLVVAARDAGLSVSVGGTLAAGGTPAPDIVRAADGRLYEAKRAGRDRAVVAR